MVIGKERKYYTDGDSPAHGYTYETEVTVDRDEIITALTDSVLNFELRSGGTITVEDEYSVDIEVCELLDDEDIDSIYTYLEENFIDDDYGTNKIYDSVYTWFDEHLPKKLDHTIDVIRMT